MTVLFVIATILFFLSLDWVVRKIRGDERAEVQPQHVPLDYPIRAPEGIFFARTHTWLSLLPSGKLRLGIDDFIGRLIDNPEITLLKHPGDAVRRGEPLFAIASGTRRLFVRAPIDGEILESNNRITSDPSLQKELLFSDGWGYVIRPKQVAQLKEFFLGAETRLWISREFRRMGDFLAGCGSKHGMEPLLMEDGGLPVPGILKRMENSDWQEFEREFLQTL